MLVARIARRSPMPGGSSRSTTATPPEVARTAFIAALAHLAPPDARPVYGVERSFRFLGFSFARTANASFARAPGFPLSCERAGTSTRPRVHGVADLGVPPIDESR